MCAEKYHKQVFNEKWEFEKHCYILLLTLDPGYISQLLSEGFVVQLLLFGIIYFGSGGVSCGLLRWFNALKPCLVEWSRSQNCSLLSYKSCAHTVLCN